MKGEGTVAAGSRRSRGFRAQDTWAVKKPAGRQAGPVAVDRSQRTLDCTPALVVRRIKSGFGTGGKIGKKRSKFLQIPTCQTFEPTTPASSVIGPSSHLRSPQKVPFKLRSTTNLRGSSS